MGLFTGKKGVILGVANQKSIAAAVAQFLHAEGAQLAFNHLPDDTGKMAKRVHNVVDSLNPVLVAPCDVTSDDSIKTFFAAVHESLQTIDFLVHSVAYAPVEDLKCPTLEASRTGFSQAMDISVYSLITTTKHAKPLMNPGASICAMTYFGGERVVPGYNLMGVCKAALDQTVRYLAYDLGGEGIRVNAISAGPIRTLASSAVGDFKAMLRCNAAQAPLQRNISAEEVGKAAGFLLSDMASATTGEILHVDSGYNTMGAPTEQMKAMMQN